MNKSRNIAVISFILGIGTCVFACKLTSPSAERRPVEFEPVPVEKTDYVLADAGTASIPESTETVLLVQPKKTVKKALPKVKKVAILDKPTFCFTKPLNNGRADEIVLVCENV
jgi:hypothetical protein